MIQIVKQIVGPLALEDWQILCCEVDPLVCAESCSGDHSISSQIVVQAGVLQAGKANSDIEYVFFPDGTSLWPFQDGEAHAISDRLPVSAVQVILSTWLVSVYSLVDTL